MTVYKTAIATAALLVSVNAFAAADGPGHSQASASPFDVHGPAVEWSKAKEHCKQLGGTWKPIRRICKIDSITTPGL